MGKPWAKYEIGFITHRKFLALNANAICLWIEGKDYADSQHTDGLLPKDAVRHFRFYSRKAVALLMRSAGAKDANGGAAFQPLWEDHTLGWKMHDYLEHNDCRETVLARIQAIEGKKQEDADRKAAWRAEKAAKKAREAECPTGHIAGQPMDAERDSPRTTEVVQQKSASIQKQQQNQKTESEEQLQKSGGSVTARSKRPVYASDRFAVFEWQLDELAKVLGVHFEDFDLHGFFDGLTQQSRQSGLVIPKTDVWEWLQVQVVAEAKRRGLPMVSTAAAPSNKRIDALMRGGQAFLNRSIG